MSEICEYIDEYEDFEGWVYYDAIL